MHKLNGLISKLSSSIVTIYLLSHEGIFKKDEISNKTILYEIMVAYRYKKEGNKGLIRRGNGIYLPTNTMSYKWAKYRTITY